MDEDKARCLHLIEKLREELDSQEKEILNEAHYIIDKYE